MWTSTLCLIATLASFAVQQGEGLTCYSCSSDTDPNCEDPFIHDDQHRLATDCEISRSSTPYFTAKPYCKKVIQTSKTSGLTIVERSCAWFNPGEDPCQRKLMKYNHLVDHCSTCSVELCNGAATSYLATAALLASLAAAKYLA